LAEGVVVEAAISEVDGKAEDSENDDEVDPAEYMFFEARRYTKVLADVGDEEG
jgi:hypothetical protein